jgi:uncharacterized protein
MTTTFTALTESRLDAGQALFDEVHPAGERWMKVLEKGQTLRIIDMEGNLAERYSLTHTIQSQGALYLTTGSKIMSSQGRTMLTIVADTCGRHDTLGGGCASESNTVRYSLEKRYMHSCRDNFTLAAAHSPYGLSKRDIVSNINFFMNVPVTPEGKLTFEDGVSAPGKYVEMRAEMDVIVLVSNCPQLNNPCNAYNPTPVRFLIWG